MFSGDDPSKLEETLRESGYKHICGIDEAGRGALAGPVVVGAVIISERIPGVNDSKLLTPKKREELFTMIRHRAEAFSVGISVNEEIDRENILNATKRSVVKSVKLLKVKPDHLILDALKVKGLEIPQISVIKGDRLVYSVSAASIVAKVIRDRIMVYYDGLYPGYGFAHNMGYGTREHFEALKKLGPCPVHRKSFRPVSEYLMEDLFER